MFRTQQLGAALSLNRLPLSTHKRRLLLCQGLSLVRTTQRDKNQIMASATLFMHFAKPQCKASAPLINTQVWYEQAHAQAI